MSAGRVKGGGCVLALAVAAGACGSAGLQGPPPAAVVRPDIDERTEPSADTRASALLAQLSAAAPAEAVRIQHELLEIGPSSLPTVARVAGDGEAAPVQRQAAAFVLGEADSEIACGTLASVWLEPTGDQRVAVAIAVALGRCGQFEPLLAIVDGAAELDVRLKAAVALGLAGTASASESIDALNRQVPPDLAMFGALAAALLGNADAARALDEQTPELAALPPDVAGFYALAWYRTGTARAGVIEALRTASVSSPDPIVRQEALTILAREADPYARTVLMTACGDPSPRVAHAAAALLDSGVDR